MTASLTLSLAGARDRSIEARRAARVAKFKRERRIIDLLNRGVSVAEIAAREGVMEKSMRAIVREILARRVPEPPAEFVALQLSRLNEALLVAYGAMSGANLRAVDRVVENRARARPLSWVFRNRAAIPPRGAPPRSPGAKPPRARVAGDRSPGNGAATA